MSDNRPTAPLSQSDHDLLIKMSSNFESFLERYRQDMLELKDGALRTVADHEIRLQKLETIVRVVEPEKALADFRALKQEVHDFKTSVGAARVVVGLFTAILGSLITFLFLSLPTILRNFGVVK